jgi:acetoin utilization deacetylase AcuC-like enzyme
MKIIFSPKCLEYEEPGHPESPERVRSTFEYLRDKFTFLTPEPCSDEDILRVHTPELLQMVKANTFFDPDTPNLPGMFEFAKLSAGAAILAAKTAWQGATAFSLMRPPGHHAGKNFLGGFCYFNNLAIAVKYSQAKLEAGKVAILDIDCHHGNGTQDVFLDEHDVLYVSLHRHPFYPGTGRVTEKNCINLPLRADTSEPVYLKTLQHGLAKIVEFQSQLLAVSAGFDTYADDPLASLGLGVKSYGKIGGLISALRLPTFLILEGGYSEEMPQCIGEFLEGVDQGGVSLRG